MLVYNNLYKDINSTDLMIVGKSIKAKGGCILSMEHYASQII